MHQIDLGMGRNAGTLPEIHAKADQHIDDVTGMATGFPVYPHYTDMESFAAEFIDIKAIVSFRNGFRSCIAVTWWTF